MNRKRATISAFILASVVAVGNAVAADQIRFGRDVLPILSNSCFQCHGPDENHREADLRLDQRESATADLGGYAALVPGNPDESELLTRVTTDDPDSQMPPPDSHRQRLTDREVSILQRWIAGGAEWGRHWAFEKPIRPAVPDAVLHPVDAFVQRRLQQASLQPTAEADRHTLIRRLSFDLTGLPPTAEEADNFLADDSPHAYAKLVERLLHSPYYGERMAMWWLDAARYADTDGYQGDATRTNWPWRDWVVQAFRENLPFDQFTIEQFAGDLLPNARPDHILATCFHRNHMTNGEGGRHPEESRIDYVIDRVNTTGTVFLGLTLGCCQCHSHKFDPISQQDYYSLFAFFDSIDEDGKAGRGAKPYFNYKSPHVARAVQEAQRIVDARNPTVAAAREQAEQEFSVWLDQQIEHLAEGFLFTPWHPLHATTLESVEGTILTQDADGIIQASGPNPRQDDYRLIGPASRFVAASENDVAAVIGVATADESHQTASPRDELSPNLSRITGLRLEIFPHPSHTDNKLSRGASGQFILTDVKLQVHRRGDSQLRDIEIASAVADAEKKAQGRNYGNVRDTLDDDPRNGWTTETHDPTKPHVAVFALAEPLSLDAAEELVFVMLHRSTRGDANIGRFRVSATDQPGPAVRTLEPMPLEELAAAQATNPADVDAKLRDRLLDQFLSDHDTYQRAKTELDRANRQLAEIKSAAGELGVMVLAERQEPRTSYILQRGVWDKKGAAVSRAVPASVLAWPAEKTETRLHLAQWLVSADNPLTARVVVNQLWQLCFGAGLVRTPEDFGLQGQLPTHPDLLDWLAVELIEHDWDLQHILRLIVTSHTYRQRSDIRVELQQRDPENRLLARGARYRIPSWMIRDAALRSSGLLNTAIGGPPVRPYQPDGVWAELFMGRFRYEPSQGAAQFRRSLYAFWRRSAAPTFLFDSAQRRVCEVRPRRTNTPLQALALLNDQSGLEASRELARVAMEADPSRSARLQLIFRRVLSRTPTDAELDVLSRELDRALTHYANTPDDVEKLLDFGQPERRRAKDPQQLAGYMLVASMVFNLDEAITHE